MNRVVSIIPSMVPGVALPAPATDIGTGQPMVTGRGPGGTE